MSILAGTALGVYITATVFVVVFFVLAYIRDKKLWNNGTCCKCGDAWERSKAIPTIIACTCRAKTVTFKRIIKK